MVGGAPAQAGALAVALAVPTLIAAGLSLLITRVRGNGPRADLRLHWSWSDVRLGLAFGLGGLFVTLPASVLYMSIVGAGRDLRGRRGVRRRPGLLVGGPC